MSESIISKAIRAAKLFLGSWANIQCHHLDSGKRVISQKSFMEIVGLKGRHDDRGTQLAKFLESPALKSEHISRLISAIRSPIQFTALSGEVDYGYEGTIVVDYCKAILEARSLGYMEGEARRQYAMACEAFIISCAKVGITALIDEATGYSQDKRKDEYRELFKDFIREEIRGWEKEFPDQFFDLIYRLYGLKKVAPNHPQFFGGFIRTYVYAPLANSSGAVLEILDDKNPMIYALGGRRYKMHQFLTDKVGLPALRTHLWQVIGIGNSVRTKGAFDAAFYRAFPRPYEQDTFEFDV